MHAKELLYRLSSLRGRYGTGVVQIVLAMDCAYLRQQAYDVTLRLRVGAISSAEGRKEIYCNQEYFWKIYDR